MTLKFGVLTIRNFMSVGAVTQTINLNCEDLTLVLGTNLDLGGEDAGSRNGVGKCLGINTMIKVRNSLTGEISEISIGDLFHAAMEQNSRRDSE